MPVIKVWCLPEKSELELSLLHESIVKAVVSIEELGLKSENDMTCLYPPDLMKYGLGTDVVIEVNSLFVRPERTAAVRRRLAKALGEAVLGLMPRAHVECFVRPFNPLDGFWSSRDAVQTMLLDIPICEALSEDVAQACKVPKHVYTRTLRCLRNESVQTLGQLLDDPTMRRKFFGAIGSFGNASNYGRKCQGALKAMLVHLGYE